MDNLIGKELGGYQIVAELGHGGMANVYRAVRPGTKREVAIKVLPAHFMQDRTFLNRFIREGEVIALLQHPRILPVYDYGEVDGVPYIVMALITGGSLLDAMAQFGPFPLENTANLVTQIAEGLDFAHKRGVIHRDFKPSNVLLDDEGNTYLADFGIAKVTEATAQLTGGGMLGTPAYMAPELINHGDVTSLVDVYALGVSVYQMLSGKLPFESNTPMGVLYAHTNHPVPDVRAARSDLPKGVQRVIERAMAKDFADRTPSAGALAQELQATVAAQKPKKQRAEKPKPEPKPAPTPAAIVEMPTFDELTPPPVKETVAAPTVSRPFRFPIWAMGALMIPLVIAAGVFILPPMFRAASGSETPQPTTDASDEPIPGETQTAVDSTDAPVDQTTQVGPTATVFTGIGSSGNPVTSNDQWIPVIENVGGVRMVLVPAGCFNMGADDLGTDEAPIHQVCFDEPFWIDETEVTVGQFKQFGGGDADQDGCGPDREDNFTHCLSWEQASEYCSLRGARLPTEAEWEYAARGPDSLTYPWGDTWEPDYVNGAPFESAVGEKPEGASWVGALDISGLAWEWVNDWYSESYYATLTGGVSSPTGPAEGTEKVLRGGMTFGTIETMPTVSMAAYRFHDPLDQNWGVSVRCARDYQPDDVPTATPTAEPSDASEQAFALAEQGVTANADWIPFIQPFDGVEMALVPVGCFIMGSDDGETDEQPMHQVCFDEPFWIDVAGVTGEQFKQFNGQAANGSILDDTSFRTSITWDEASAFCNKRAGRLPTEAEWEYAIRGPDGVTDLPGGGPDSAISSGWVGPIAGYLREWMNDWYSETYYTTVKDGAVNPQGPESGTEKILRGNGMERVHQTPDSASSSHGIRCARNFTRTPSDADSLEGNQ